MLIESVSKLIEYTLEKNRRGNPETPATRKTHDEDKQNTQKN